MTKVIHLASPRAGVPVQMAAHTIPTPAQQAAIENALSMALYFVRQPGNATANIWAATARTNRALTLLKHVSDGRAATSPANAGNTLGRA